MTLLWVFIAGGLGSAARYLVALAFAGMPFPFGTLVVNLAGSFLLGLLFQLAPAGGVSAEMRTVLAAGFLGGFTTYSSFNQETVTMLMGSATGSAVLYIGVTVLGCLAAGTLGMLAARQL